MLKVQNCENIESLTHTLVVRSTVNFIAVTVWSRRGPILAGPLNVSIWPNDLKMQTKNS